MVSENVYRYHRHTPHLATSGALGEGALEELERHGFTTIIDLRTAQEGTETAEQLARATGFRYHNLPIAQDWPDESTIASFARLVEDQSNYPILVHCRSANRVGALWAAYQLHRGHSYDEAVLQGRTIGMSTARERQLEEIRKRR